jgi:hypothetical protein
MGNRASLPLMAIIAGGPRLRIYPPTLNIHPRQYRQRRPKHSNEEQKRIAYIARPISDDADDQRTDEGRRL